MQRPDVISAFHAQAKSEAWVECQQRIQGQLKLGHSESSVTMLPRVLEKIPVLLFVGDQDLICNYMGQESLIQSLTWNGGTGLGVCFALFIVMGARLIFFFFGRKWRLRLGPLAAPPLGHGFPREI